MLYDRPADGKPEPCALLERVEFDEALEDCVLPFGGDTAAGVRNPEIELSGTEFVAEADRSPVREFRGVRQQVYHQLRKAVAVGADVAGFIPLFEYQLHVLVRN